MDTGIAILSPSAASSQDAIRNPLMAPSHYQQEQKFWDEKGASAYVSLSAFDQQRILRWIGRKPNELRCLDLGGGSGMTAKMLTASGVPFLVCLDISAAMLKHSGMTAVQADALRLPFANGSFDLIVAAAFLHHVPGRENAVLRECARVLAPGGRIVGYDPSARCVQNRVFMGEGRFRLATFSPDERPIDPRALTAGLADAGFKNVTSMPFSFRNPRITLFEAIQRWLLDPLSIGPLKHWLKRWFFWSGAL
jgi:SAM-dependent methyltransferase